KTDAINAGDVISQPPTNNNPGGGDNAGDNAGNGGEQQAGVEDLSSALPGLSAIAERGMNQHGSSDVSPEETQAVAAVASAFAVATSSASRRHTVSRVAATMPATTRAPAASSEPA